MNNWTLEPMTLEHLRCFPRLASSYASPEDYEDYIMRQEHSWVGLCDGIPCVAGGFIELWPNVAEAWTHIAEGLTIPPIFLHRAVKQSLTTARAKYHRIQANCFMGNAMSTKWLETLGFVFEGIMFNYTTDKRDVMRYALY